MKTLNNKFCGIKIVNTYSTEKSYYRHISKFNYSISLCQKNGAILPISPPNKWMSWIKNGREKTVPFGSAHFHVPLTIWESLYILTVLSVILELCALSTRDHLNTSQLLHLLFNWRNNDFFPLEVKPIVL